MTADEARLKLLLNQCSNTIPGFKVKFKNESAFQRFLGFIMFWNRGYMTDFISTFFPVVWWTTRKDYEGNPWGSFKVLTHEWVHLWDDKEHRGWFGFSYISVQVWCITSVLALLSIWFGLWFLFFLAGLLFLAPWPSPWRIKWELRGYAMTMAVNYWKHGSVKEETKDWIVETLTGSGYYFPAWSKKRLRKKLDRIVEDLESGEILNYGHAFRAVSGIVKASDRNVIDAAKAGLLAPLE